tara:strand:+ start:896 stop:1534 length:639 start_codon:yes stop_codon:yes gene_type:complete
MKINEVVNKAFSTKLFKARIKLNQGSYKQLVDTTVVAKNVQMAIKLLKAQYGKDSVVGNPKVIQDLTESECPQCQQDLAEATQRLDPKCWTGYRKDGTQMKDGVRVNKCVKVSEDEYTYEGDISMWYADEQLDEAEYQGRKVSLGKPMQGDVAKFKVYVKNEKGNVIKVNFGDKTMRIKKSNPARRKSFRARHKCATPGPRTKARYWSCRKW